MISQYGIPNSTRIVNVHHWAVSAIGKHIEAQKALSGACVGVSIDESTDSRIVISGLEIIEPGLYFLAGAKRPIFDQFSVSSNHVDPPLNYT
jgi:hypothetical protein